MPPRPRVFTIPASAKFLPTLIGALRDGRLIEGFPSSADPLALANATLFLPTRRACALARDAFLEVLDVEAAVLPRIVPLGDIDEDELAFAAAASGEAGLDIPEATQPLERRLLLAQLILKWIATPGMRTESGQPLVANTPASALSLADALARLMDDMTTRQVPWNRLDGLVPPEHDEYWQKTLEFLRIARDYWPAELASRSKIDPAERRDLLIEAERQRLETHSGPVIAAGSTGSMPATAKLLDTIAKLPHGAVVLPGLDVDLDDESWDLIGGTDDHPPASGHPQLAMHALLRRIGMTRRDVAMFGTSGARERLTSEAMRPSDATERWAQRIDQTTRDAALGNLVMIEAANAEEEALAIAVALREAVENNRTAALVTPDRALARRVAASLGRWNIEADDSGGDALPDTEAGVFARLVAQATLGGLAPVPLLALLKHARFRLGAAPGRHHRAIAALELAVLRGPRPRPGAKGLAHALASFRREKLHPSDPRRRVMAGDLDDAQALVEKLGIALASLEALKGAQPFTAIAALHADALRALSTDDAGAAAAFDGEDGTKLAEAFAEIAEQQDALQRGARRLRRPVRGRDRGPCLPPSRQAGRAGAYPRHHRGAARSRRSRGARRAGRGRMAAGDAHRSVAVAARCGSNWGSICPSGASVCRRTTSRSFSACPRWSSRAPESSLARRRSRRVSRSDSRRSRASRHGRTRSSAASNTSNWARDLDRAEIVKSVARPRPRPPLSARPMRLSVTEIEHWLRDPYTIYAKHVLKLLPLDAVDTDPGARDRGNVIHGAIGEFTEKYATGLPADPLRELLALGEAHFAPLADYPEARAFWWPRFQRIARWFVAWDAQRRANAAALHAELRAELDIEIDSHVFKLTTRADRIERLCRWLIRDPRLQDRPTADGKPGAHRPFAAAHAGRRDPARRKIQGPAAGSDRPARLRGAARARSGG